MSIRDAVRAGVIAPAEFAEKTVRTEWGPVIVREMAGADFDHFLEAINKYGGKDDNNPGQPPRRVRTAALLYCCCFDPDTGGRIFELSDVPAIAAAPLNRYQELYAEADELNQPKKPKEEAEEEAGKSRAGADAGGG